MYDYWIVVNHIPMRGCADARLIALNLTQLHIM
jgi:hypothetical protein